MHPINKKNFGTVHKKLLVTVRNVGNSANVSATVLKQIGSTRFIVTTDGGTTKRIVRLAQTAADVTAMTGGNQTLCTVDATPHGGSAKKVKFFHSKTLVTHDGVRYKYNMGVASAAVGEATVTTVANSNPTVANQIPDQTGTVAGAFSYVIPANTFADVDGQTLTLSMNTVTGFAFNAATRTVSKAAGASTVGAQTITITANDGAGGTISDSFTVTLS